MKYMCVIRKRILSFLFIGALCVFVPIQNAFAQTSGLELEADLSSALEMAQVLGLSSLGIDATGRGPVIFSFTMTNTNATRLENLFLDVVISSSSRGVLAEVFSSNNTPFALEAGERIFGTNNNLADEEVPGIDESLSFDGELTDAGEDLVNSLEGSTTLPVDLYQVQVRIYQTNNRLNGGTLIAEQTVEVGGGSAGDVRDIFLKAPGDVVGTEVEINNPLPEFSWDGEIDLDYRLILVKGNGIDSPESLLQAAMSTNATNDTNQGAGSLLEFENLDLIVQGINFQYPANGVLALEAGSRYYWQLIAQITTGAGVEERPSTVWNFTLAAPSTGTATVALDQETIRSLIRIIGQERYQELVAAGFKLESIRIDDQDITGPALVQKLAEIIRRIDDEEIAIDSNN